MSCCCDQGKHSTVHITSGVSLNSVVKHCWCYKNQTSKSTNCKRTTAIANRNMSPLWNLGLDQSNIFLFG